ncbi:MAG: M20/M25/M40 family metallo-hydrolase [Burkholderiales bacterium]|nr:M20/M25/M40 family metallo-hydrolase [Burkholderiales bacterium]
MKHWPRILVLAVLATAFGSARAELSDVEKRIVEAVKARSPTALALLQKSVVVNSGTLNTEGVKEVGRLFRAELDEVGFATRWIDMPASMQRAGHLAGKREGVRGKRLLLLGHMDTVFEPSSPVTPWAVDGQRIRGQGVSDMKGGVVIMLEALRALKSVGALDGSTVAVLLTGDEESVGQPTAQARADLIAMARASDIALSFEGMGRETNGGESVAVARRGAGSWSLTVTGKQGHSSAIFGPGAGFGAAYELARIVNAFREQLIEPGLTFGAGVMLAGTEVDFDPALARGTAAGKSNIVPPRAIARGDLRALTAEQRDRARSRMRDIVGHSLPGTSAAITFAESYPPMAATPANHALQELYSQVSVDLGHGRVEAGNPESRGAGDVQFAAPHAAALDGLGAAGGGSHSPLEYLLAESIEKNAIRAAIMIYRLTR